jgi:hypothetical protein
LAICTYALLAQSMPANASVEEVQPVGPQGMAAGRGLYAKAPQVAHTADVRPIPELYAPAEQVVDRQLDPPVVAVNLAWVQRAQAVALAADA